VVDQFNSIDVGGGLHHNGRQVLGEALGASPWPCAPPLIRRKARPGHRPFHRDKRFFIAFARVWGTKMRDEATRLQLNTNAHPLAQWRAIATLRNMPEFQTAFQCMPGDPIVRPPEQQCKVW
jgi:predicted metalloendopeptidase